MSSQFTRDHIKISVAKILQTLGWHTINTTPLEILTDILHNYLFQLSKLTNEYANEFGFTDPNLDHLGLAFREIGISLPELEEYVKYVNFGVASSPVSKYPVPKEDQLNFLKPGSKEVVTRPVHIHEHLPPMNPILEGAIVEKAVAIAAAENEDETCSDNKQVFKKPPDIPPMEFKKLKRDEEGSRPTREISSVMMTTSGFLSPAREGKLPESKTPMPPPIEPPPPPAPLVNPPSNTELPTEVIPVKKPQKLFKKVEKKKEKVGKELFKANHEDRIKKNHSKDSAKIKQIKALTNASALLSNLPQGLDVVKLPPIPHVHKMNSMKFNNKALQAARLKTEKLNTTITPLPMKPVPVNNLPNNYHSQIHLVDKLLNVPDKKKVNILKKISNVKEKMEEKVLVKKEDTKEEPVSPPELVIDEPEDMIPKLAHLRGDITIEPINPPIHNEGNIKVEPTYFDDSSAGTPSTPKTPEMIPTPAPIVVKDKKKRKPKVRKPKPEDQPLLFGSFNEAEALVERPKTPKADLDLISHQQPPAPPTPDFSFGNLNPYHLAAGRPNIHFLANFGGPGLIPPPLGNPLNPLSNPLFPNHFPLLNLPDFGQHPYLPQNLPTLPNPLANFLPKMDEMPSSSSSVLEPVSLPPPRTPEPVATSSVKLEKSEKKSKEHKRDKKDKLKKKAKKEKLKAKAEKKEEKKKIKKKEKREKRKEKEGKEDTSVAVPKLTLKLKSPSPRPVTPDTTTKKLNIKPVVKKEPEVSEEPDSEVSSLAKISALVTGPPKPKNVPPPVVPALNANYPNHYAIAKKKHKLEHKPIPKIKVEIKKEPIFELPPAPPSKYVDAEGNEVWICPGCSRQDDGSPMIGCDGCDAWYHWVCVGIQVPPDENEDWYCRHCLLKKDEDLQSDKKKKRKRKEKKEHQ